LGNRGWLQSKREIGTMAKGAETCKKTLKSPCRKEWKTKALEKGEREKDISVAKTTKKAKRQFKEKTASRQFEQSEKKSINKQHEEGKKRVQTARQT